MYFDGFCARSLDDLDDPSACWSLSDATQECGAAKTFNLMTVPAAAGVDLHRKRRRTPCGGG
jgi:hypothetical protein